MRRFLSIALALLALLLPSSSAQKSKPTERPPHGQDSPPGPALTPAEALKKMKVPAGFSVELVVAEPDIVNPVSMCFDEKGRVWITESLEYPRRSAGVGKDRVKCIEIGPDGKASKVTTFAEGLNIPSGIAVGPLGKDWGVYVANAPDILFYKMGPDGKAAGKPEVVVTGFGRTDTHELPNSLTWGPDGWLYGWNGVFNYSNVKHKGKEYAFTCAIFRIHPQTRDFELFCEGTSNPWGLAIDEHGSFFASACVIDHLWHLTETGYYIRQGGPYPPFTWPARSIVKHKHQKAAYCGLTWFDSDAYPKEYREKLFMGNIHGGCINSDVLTREGSTYFANKQADFLTANDQWFMPVVQKVGPDGSLYILDWYDRYHCYQDANRDPAGIDRKNGRLYRVRYQETPRVNDLDMSKESDDKLIERLGHANVFYRDWAQQLFLFRMSDPLRSKLEQLVLAPETPEKQRRHALWSLVGSGTLSPSFHQKVLAHKDSTTRAWGVRAAGNMGKVDPKIRETVSNLVTDPSPDVRLQVVIAARKIADIEPMPLLVQALKTENDKLIPNIVWQNLHPLLETQATSFIAEVRKQDMAGKLGEILPRSVDRILAAKKAQPEAIVGLYELVAKQEKPDIEAVRKILATLSNKAINGEIRETLPAIKKALWPILATELAKPSSPLKLDITILGVLFNESNARDSALSLLERTEEPEFNRVRIFETLVAMGDEKSLSAAEKLLDAKLTLESRTRVLSALGRIDKEQVASIVLSRYEKFDIESKPRALEMLTQRTSWSKILLKAIAEKKIPVDVLNVNQARRMLSSKDKELIELVTKHYGKIRDDRNPEREKVVSQMRTMLEKTKGDPKRGIEVYKKLCAQCHKIHGEGEDVGPDITLNGRASFEQLLSNVFDPSLVIGPSYQAVTVVTTKGRSLTGLLVEDSPTRVVMKVQGGKQEIIPRSEVEEQSLSKMSLMPEDVEKQLKAQEITDLFSFLVLDKPPSDPNARRVPGTPKGL